MSYWVVLAGVVVGLGISTMDVGSLLKVAHELERVGVLARSTPASNVANQASLAQQHPAVVASQPLSTVVDLHAHTAPQSEAELLSAFDQLATSAQQQWGKDNVVLPDQQQIVKYSPDMRSRSIIDLKEGKLIVESLDGAQVDVVMHQALTNALLTPDDPREVNLLSTTPDVGVGKPFLLGQIADSLGKPIDSLAKAQKFAAWAVVNKMYALSTPVGKVKRIELPLDLNHKQVRAARFAHYIEAAAAEFGLDENLLYAITETESHFNPFAISRTGALGLMQLMASRAGTDAMKQLTGQNRAPSYQELTDPQTNVRLGAAYLALLGNRYLKSVQDPKSKEYAMIAAYNGGSSRVFRVFGKEKDQAVATLNKLPASIVYDALITGHSSAETRGYLEKVTNAKKRYSSRV